MPGRAHHKEQHSHDQATHVLNAELLDGRGLPLVSRTCAC